MEKKNLLTQLILEACWKLLPFPFLLPPNSFGYNLERVLKSSKERCNTLGQQPTKKKTGDTEKAYFAHYVFQILDESFHILKNTFGEYFRGFHQIWNQT